MRNVIMFQAVIICFFGLISIGNRYKESPPIAIFLRRIMFHDVLVFQIVLKKG